MGTKELRFGLATLGFAVLTIPGLSYAAAQSGQKAAPVPAQSNSQQADSGYQLQLWTPLVLEDLVAVDRKGRPVHGLKITDLKVTEDGKPAALQNFEEHITVAQPSAAALKMPDLGPNTFTNLVANPNAGSWNILLLDTLNTSIADQDEVRRQMLDYVKTLPPSVPFAIFALDTRLHLLQGFTADPSLLRAAIEQREKDPHISPLLDSSISDDQDDLFQLRMPTKLSEVVSDLHGIGDVGGVKRVEAVQAEDKAQRRGIITEEALVELGRYLAALPERKNLIWFSSSFPLAAIPNVLVQDRVAVYPVDARGGVIVPPPPPPPPKAGAQPQYDQQVVALQAEFQNAVRDQHKAMTDLAEATGGKAFYDTNGFKNAIEFAVNDGDNFYTFTYTPSDRKLDGSFRKIEVKCNRPGLQLYYRKGYFAVDPNAVAHGANTPVQDAAHIAMQLATRPGAPDATQILFELKVVPGDKQVDTLSTGATPDAALMKPPYQRYMLFYRVALGDAVLTTSSDGNRHGSLEFAALVYNSEGALVNTTADTLKMNLPEPRYAEMVKRGLSVNQTVEAPAKGDYFLRIVVYDPNGDRVGTIEVPVAGLKSGQAVLSAATKIEKP